MNNDQYIPITCHFYDELESLAVKRIKSTITYIDETNSEITINENIVDFKTKNKKEFMILSNNKKIRLDKIKSVNGITPKKSC